MPERGTESPALVVTLPVPVAVVNKPRAGLVGWAPRTTSPGRPCVRERARGAGAPPHQASLVGPLLWLLLGSLRCGSLRPAASGVARSAGQKMRRARRTRSVLPDKDQTHGARAPSRSGGAWHVGPAALRRPGERAPAFFFSVFVCL